MKKVHDYLMAILFALCSTVSFTACSSSDDESPSAETIKENIIGMWQTTHVSGWAYDDTEDENLIKVDQEVTEDSKYARRILFKGDGSCYSFFYGKSSEQWISLSNYFTYDISGNKIILYFKNEVDETYTVLSLTDDTLVLQITMEDGLQYKTTMTCKRVY